MKKKKRKRANKNFPLPSVCFFLVNVRQISLFYILSNALRDPKYIQTYPHGAASVVQLDYTQCCACMLNMRVASNRESKIMTRKNLISV